MSKAHDTIIAAANTRADKLTGEVAQLKAELKGRDEHLKHLTRQIEESERIAAKKVPKLVAAKRPKAAKHLTRVIIPDSHGAHIDPVARDAFLADLKMLRPEQIVMLGDHLDCGGTFNAHQVSCTNELVESYEDDVVQANAFLDAIRAYAPDARIHYIEGNHEAHVERWCARNVKRREDADSLIEHWGPAARLHLKAREITYYRSKDFHMGLTVRGSIQLGKCFFTHGVSHSKHADDAHLAAFNSNVVFGHVHRVLEVRSRTVTSSGHGAWSPGTLALLQPLYRHTEPTTWCSGYGIQFCSAASGRFAMWNVPIFADGSTGLAEAVGAFSRE